MTWTLASEKDHGTNGSVQTLADIEGKWVTSQLRITPGKYLVTMTEFAQENGMPIQFAQKSSQLTLTVDGTLDTILAMRDAYLVNPSKDVGGVMKRSEATVNLQVVPEIGTLANSLDSYSTVGLSL